MSASVGHPKMHLRRQGIVGAGGLSRIMSSSSLQPGECKTDPAVFPCAARHLGWWQVLPPLDGDESVSFSVRPSLHLFSMARGEWFGELWRREVELSEERQLWNDFQMDSSRIGFEPKLHRLQVVTALIPIPAPTVLIVPTSYIKGS